MKCTSLFAVLFGGVAWAVCLAAETSEPLDLSGREVVVRVYDNWQQDPWAFQTITVSTEGPTVYFDFKHADGNAIFVILADEQQDPDVKTALGDVVYAEPYKQGLTYTLGTYNRSSVQNKLRALVDGLGNPLVGATAEIYLKGTWPEWHTVGLSQMVLKDTNRFKVPIAVGSLTTFEIVVSHPDYGITLAEIYRHDLRDEVFVPVLKASSEQYKRSIWGTVVDPHHVPIPGVLLRSCALYALGGGKLTCKRAYGVRTDEQGRFCMYLPLEDGKLVPNNSEYEVSISPPRALGLRGPGGTIRNGQESTIVLRARPGSFRTFVFKDENGPITDVERLKKIVVRVDAERNSIKYIYSSWKDGRIFPPGTYRAEMKIRPKRVIFEAITVTENSPEQLVFKAKYPQAVYDGYVVHGITGEPMPGVIVVCTTGIAEEASSLTAQQWQAIHALEDDFSPDCNALAPFRVEPRFSKLTRTDEHGRFQVNFVSGKDNDFWTFSAVEENYLVGFQYRMDLEPDKDGNVSVPDIKLFPTAKVLLELHVEDTNNAPPIWPGWGVTGEDNPDWQDRLPYQHGSSQVMPDEVYSMDVPAGFNLRVEVDVGGESNPRWSPIIIKGINLQQGEKLDLGKLTFEPTLPIFVAVINSRGEPVEGVTVRHKCERGLRKYWDNTDEEGIAAFSAPAHSKGEFCICADKGEFNIYGPDLHDPALKESMTYAIAGPEDANSVYTLQVSDEILHHLFK